MDSIYKKNNNKQHHQQKSSFLPMVCRVSSKDARFSQRKDRASSFSKEPSSPKVSCIGQLVNKNNNVKAIGFATPYRHHSTTTPSSKTRSSISNHSHAKHTKPQNFLRTIKNAIIAGASAANSNSSSNLINVNACRSRSCTATRERCIIKRIRVIATTGKASEKSASSGCKNGFVDQVKIISEMDPPLPVIKKVAQPHRLAGGCGGRCDEVNLWKRRCCRTPLRAFQIDRFQLTSSQQLSSARTTLSW